MDGLSVGLIIHILIKMNWYACRVLETLTTIISFLSNLLFSGKLRAHVGERNSMLQSDSYTDCLLR